MHRAALAVLLFVVSPAFGALQTDARGAAQAGPASLEVDVAPARGWAADPAPPPVEVEPPATGWLPSLEEGFAPVRLDPRHLLGRSSGSGRDLRVDAPADAPRVDELRLMRPSLAVPRLAPPAIARSAESCGEAAGKTGVRRATTVGLSIA